MNRLLYSKTDERKDTAIRTENTSERPFQALCNATLLAQEVANTEQIQRIYANEPSKTFVAQAASPKVGLCMLQQGDQ